jgi:hypothetical protein
MKSTIGSYVYCIIRYPGEVNFDDLQAIGDSQHKVRTIPFNEISAVVSDSHTKEYDSTRANVLCHEKILEILSKDYPLLPVRFGTVANSGEARPLIRRLLEKRYNEFVKLFDEVEDKVELGLKAFWRNESAIYEEIVSGNSDIKKLFVALKGKTGQAARMDQIRLGEMTKAALDRKRDGERSRLLEPLRPIASRMVENTILLDKMILNGAFLVEKVKESKFDEAVNILDQAHEHRILFKYVGPVPPYNFINLTINWDDI